MKVRGRLSDLKVSYETKRPVVSFEVIGKPEDIEKYRDKDLDVTFVQHREKRSLDANACLWACLNDIAMATGIDKWTLYLKYLREYGQYTYLCVVPEAVERLRSQWREIEVVGDRVTYNEAGEEVIMNEVLCYFGSSTYNSKEFSRLLDGVIEGMRDLGLPSPMTEEVKAMIEEIEHDTTKRLQKEGRCI